MEEEEGLIRQGRDEREFKIPFMKVKIEIHSFECRKYLVKVLEILKFLYISIQINNFILS